jgi:transcriptional regulator with XRE-family HTH domain
VHNGNSALRSAREHAGLTMTELARLAGVDRATVGRLEANPRFTPTLPQVVVALASVGYINGGPIGEIVGPLERRLDELENRFDLFVYMLRRSSEVAVERASKGAGNG